MQSQSSTTFRRWISVLALSAALAGGALADPVHSLTGTSLLVGRYEYANNSQPAVPFTLAITTAADGNFTGETTEPPTFGNGSSVALTAGVKGLISDTTLQFTKTYDGSGGQTHSVEYAGSIGADGRSMKGTWRVDQLHGTFSATLVSVYNRP